MHFDSCHVYIFLHPTVSEKNKNTNKHLKKKHFTKEYTFTCVDFLTSSILIDEVNNYISVILRIASFDLNCPFFYMSGFLV